MSVIAKFLSWSALSLTLLAVGAARAGVVLSDNFDGEAGGATVLNYTGFSHFDAIGVDLLGPASGFAGSGSFVNLGGSGGQHRASMVTRPAYDFNAGNRVTLAFDISGNQVGTAAQSDDQLGAGFIFLEPTNVLDISFNGAHLGDRLGVMSFDLASLSDTPWDQPWTRSSISFLTGNDGSLFARIGTASSDGAGPLLDNVSLSIDVPEPGTWALILCGFGLAGAALRRRTVVAT